MNKETVLWGDLAHDVQCENYHFSDSNLQTPTMQIYSSISVYDQYKFTSLQLCKFDSLNKNQKKYDFTATSFPLLRSLWDPELSL